MTNDNITIEPIAYRVLEFCQKYVISKSTFYREVKSCRLQMYKRGRTTLVTRVEAERWYASLSTSLQQDDAITRHPQQIGGSVLTAP